RELKTVVITAVGILYLVNVREVRILREKGPALILARGVGCGRVADPSGAEGRRVDIDHLGQFRAMIPDVRHIEGEVAGKLPLQTEVPRSDVGRTQSRIDCQDRAGRGRSASDLPGWKDWSGERPIELRAGERESASGHIARAWNAIKQTARGRRI